MANKVFNPTFRAVGWPDQGIDVPNPPAETDQLQLLEAGWRCTAAVGVSPPRTSGIACRITHGHVPGEKCGNLQSLRFRHAFNFFVRSRAFYHQGSSAVPSLQPSHAREASYQRPGASLY